MNILIYISSYALHFQYIVYIFFNISNNRTVNGVTPLNLINYYPTLGGDKDNE